MKKIYNLKKCCLIFLIQLVLQTYAISYGQNFSQSQINFNGYQGISNGTSLMFGPDGRLYVTEYTGAIKIYDIERISATNYKVIDLEILTGINSIQNHNDDGSLYNDNLRETTGLTVGGTPANPVVYVASSDFRIGGGPGGGSGDTNLDTNSGIITRFTWTGSSWEVVDLVRGLPRSEENHATNGMELANINGVNYLIVAQGGHTNAGSPSVNFAHLTEYALSAAILSINLDVINSLPVQLGNGRKFIYDLPTVDDPTRPNINGIANPDEPGYDGKDINDPFGGNDGLNQAKLIPGGPVQIFSPGYRNCFDLVITENGAVYVTENGANGGWGGFPVNEGGGSATNNYDPTEPGSSIAIGGEIVNNKDHLHLITPNVQNYTFGSFYGGHPAPIRANPNGAGLYTKIFKNGTENTVFRTKKYHPLKNNSDFSNDPNITLPADWPPVPISNPVEGDYRGPEQLNPDGPIDDIITSWGTNTNSIDEYTASNFNGAMKGNLLAGVNTGKLRRVELLPDGSLEKLTPSFISGLGGDALGVTCNSDSDKFPGTIWIVTLNGKLSILEPQDFGMCLEPDDPNFDANADYDLDSYSNQDEIDNGTDPCNGGSQPNDFDKADSGQNISDLNDADDDNDNIPDANDPFQIGDPKTSGSDAFLIPVNNELFSSNTELGGYLGLGMTGLMNNGDPNPNWLNWLDRRDDPNDPNENDILGGAIGAMTMQMTAGTALGTANTQEKAFQYGVQTNSSSANFSVEGGIANFNGPVQLYGNPDTPDGELGFFIGDGTQSNYLKFVISKYGISAIQEINDIPGNPLKINIPEAERPNSNVNFYFEVNPISGEVTLRYSKDSGPQILLGSLIAQGSILEAIQQEDSDLAVGFIGTSNITGKELEGTWDFLRVLSLGPTIISTMPDIERVVGITSEEIILSPYFDDNEGIENLSFSITGNTNNSIQAVIQGQKVVLTYPNTPAITNITIRATDNDNNFIEQSFQVTLIEQGSNIPEVLYRVNAGGPTITSIDEFMDWEQDTEQNNSTYLTYPGLNSTFTSAISNYDNEIDQNSIPVNIFNTERFDSGKGEPNMTYSFPVDQPGIYEVRLYMGNGYSGTSAPGTRIFNVSLEGIVYPALKDIDLSAKFGHQVGGVITQEVEVNDGVLEIAFIHGPVENPLLNGIEILGIPTGSSNNPIQVSAVQDQVNTEGDDLDGSLGISASGGDGNLNYSMTGAPPGVSIEPTNGQIGGSIQAGAAQNSPYIVTVTVDDSDEQSNDAVSVSWNWTIESGNPVIASSIPDIQRVVGITSEEIILSPYFDDNEGVENLSFSITGNTNNSIQAVIQGQKVVLTYPNIPAITNITIRATDNDNNFIEQSFQVTLIEQASNIPEVLYRVNAGGPTITSIDEFMDWEQDTRQNKSTYLKIPGKNNTYNSGINSFSNEVDPNSIPVNIFAQERYDSEKGEPNMTYSFPVDQPGIYEVRLYMGNGYSGTSTPGTRIFNVSLEGIVYPALKDIDLSAKFGHQVGGVITQEVEVNDGVLEIAFIHGPVENPLLNGIEILGIPTGSSNNPIQVSAVQDQVNVEGDDLDGSLGVSASGGDGNLNYSMTGAPPGVSIEPTNGQIGGNIQDGAAQNSPYIVTVTVDDSDGQSNDAVSVSWNWTIQSGDPVIVSSIPDIQRVVGITSEEITLLPYFDDNEGVENLSFSITGNTNNSIQAVIQGQKVALTYPNTPAITNITIRATDNDNNFIEQSFQVTLIEQGSNIPEVLYRVNAGGPTITSIDEFMDWEQDTRQNKSTYLKIPGKNNTYNSGINSFSNEVDPNSIPVNIFAQERYDSEKGEPNMTYSFPVDQPGIYEVRLYMGNGYSGTSTPGTRIFNVSLEGIVYPALKDIDLSAKFGHQVGGVITQEVEVNDGVLEIAFIHGPVENPLLNGIEILGISPGSSNNLIQVSAVQDQVNTEGDDLDGSLVVSASGGDGNLNYSMTGAPPGVSIEPTNGQIGGSIQAGAAQNSPYNVTVTVDDSDSQSNDAVSVSWNWTVTNSILKWTEKNESENYTSRHENSFVQAGDKFYLLGGRENAKTLDIYDYTSNTWSSLINSAPYEFNHFQATEYKGLIWVIGAFRNNNFPNEIPEEFIWIFNPVTQKWTQGPEIPEGRRRGSAGLVVYNDKFYIVGGNTLGHNGGAVAWLDEFDPETGVWTVLPDAPRARDHFHAVIMNDNIYAIGGRLSGGNGGTFKPVIPEVDIFNFDIGIWETLPEDKNLPTPRAAAATVNFKGKILVMGGEVQNEIVYGDNLSDALKITEEFDPNTTQWDRGNDLNHKRHGTQAIVSGEAVYILAGSPVLGGGSQKNMEYLGIDVPNGSPLQLGSVKAPTDIFISSETTTELILENNGGNLGRLITDIEITGPGSDQFEITSKNSRFGIIKPSDSKAFEIVYNGITPNESAELILHLDSGEILTVNLISEVAGFRENFETSQSFSINQLFPNPGDDIVFIKVSDPRIEIEEIYVFGINGTLFNLIESPRPVEPRTFKLNVSRLANGIYFVKLKSVNHQSFSKTMIINR